MIALKVLVVGGTRFIGAHLVRQLYDAGAEVTVFHRGTTTNPILPDVEHVRDQRASYPITEFPVEVRRDWDVVVHMVAMGSADANAAVQTFSGRTQRMVVVSSSDVYRAYGRLIGLEPGLPDLVSLNEDAPLRSVFYPYRGREAKIGAYAHDYEKILVEQTVQNAKGFDWTILRLPKVYGPEDNGDLATVYGFSAVPDWRWTHGHVTNVAAAIAVAITHPLACNEIFNVGEAKTPTMGERLALLPIRTGTLPGPPPFNFDQPLVTDTMKIRRVLGFDDVVDESSAMELVANLQQN